MPQLKASAKAAVIPSINLITAEIVDIPSPHPWGLRRMALYAGNNLGQPSRSSDTFDHGDRRTRRQLRFDTRHTCAS